MPMKLIIVSNRLPLTVTQKNDKYKITPSAGGLTTGLHSLETKMEKHWVGWPGIHFENDIAQIRIESQFRKHQFHPVYLTPDLVENYYEGYSNSIIWPSSHYFFSYVQHKDEYWEAYKEVNQLFCEKTLEIFEPGDIIWVQDYQLMLLPGLLRKVIPNACIGYFHHIPFPSYELFRCLPERSEILKGLLGADLIAFHTHSYMRHFISAIYRILKLDCVFDEIHVENRVINVDAFPMGINYQQFHDAIQEVSIKRKADKFRENFGAGKLILSVDRLDYTKGILTRLQSFDKLLADCPQYREKVSLAMIVSPSRDSVERYAHLKEEIDKAVGSINGQYSTLGWRPVYYFYRSFNFEELAALYNIADIGLVTSYRDGMNLVAKEYVASKQGKQGVLILSEMAGAAIELHDAIIVNPNNINELKEAFVEALEMPESLQAKNLEKMQAVIAKQNVGKWAKDFVQELFEVRDKNLRLQAKIIKDFRSNPVKQAYRWAKKRLLILDYDGTLSAFFSDPAAASPTPEVLQLLRNLSSDPLNKVVICSGRDRQTLDEWFGDLPIGLSAEHGTFYKTDGEWHSKAHNDEWDSEIMEIMQRTQEKTPHSKLESKETALVWHYRDVDVWLAEMRANQLINALVLPCMRCNLQIMKGNKIVEVKHSDCNKGSEASRLMEEDKYDFVLAIGDDTTDEDMFNALPATAFTIKVGKTSQVARYNLPEQSRVVPFLSRLNG